MIEQLWQCYVVIVLHNTGIDNDRTLSSCSGDIRVKMTFEHLKDTSCQARSVCRVQSVSVAVRHGRFRGGAVSRHRQL
jgi:hypothetical protein